MAGRPRGAAQVPAAGRRRTVRQRRHLNLRQQWLLLLDRLVQPRRLDWQVALLGRRCAKHLGVHPARPRGSPDGVCGVGKTGQPGLAPAEGQEGSRQSSVRVETR